MTEPALAIQEPGAIAALDHSKLEALVDSTVSDLVEALDGLDDLELEQLSVLETAGKGRTTALGAIAREQERRALDADMPAESPAETPNVGDATSYAQMRAAEIDSRVLVSPVLTLDGWLLPTPKAQPE